MEEGRGGTARLQGFGESPSSSSEDMIRTAAPFLRFNCFRGLGVDSCGESHSSSWGGPAASPSKTATRASFFLLEVAFLFMPFLVVVRAWAFSFRAGDPELSEGPAAGGSCRGDQRALAPTKVKGMMEGGTVPAWLARMCLMRILTWGWPIALLGFVIVIVSPALVCGMPVKYVELEAAMDDHCRCFFPLKYSDSDPIR
jgi:hypothetical protein